LFLIAMAVAGLCFGEKAAHRELFGQVSGLVGRDGAQAIQSLVTAANPATVETTKVNATHRI
jgi:membrane protein